jgi:radical SAM protein with 4Fe4S-binding SPASM domain
MSLRLPPPRLRELTLTLGSQCNLGCTYCYVPRTVAHRMNEHVVCSAIELLVAHADSSRPVTLSFFGGEPFLYRAAMEQAIGHAADRLRAHSPRFVTPTNGLLLDDHALEACRAHDIRLAISVDGISQSARRCYADGRDSGPDLLAIIPRLLQLPSAARMIARMTVTPSNVASLAANVRAIAALGFKKIVYLPDVDQPWGDDDIALWAREHRRLGTWLIGAAGAGIDVPDLPVWRGIESRLLLAKPKRPCGAGESIVAVTPDGRIVPCYRFAFEQGEHFVLGHVDRGFTRDEVRARFLAVRPDELRPEHGTCERCDAHDGCTHICPAQGMIAMGDPNGVPDVVCRLMRAQVEVIRSFAVLRRRPRRRVPRPAWAAAVVSAAMATVVSTASCGGKVETGKTGSIDAGQEAGSDASSDTTSSDASRDAAWIDSEGPGVCPVQVDAANDTVGPGICDPQLDAAEELSPGVCPMMQDAADDAFGPGICP